MAESTLSRETLEFARTLPEEYATEFPPNAIEQHRRLSLRRGSAPIDVGIFDRRGNLTGICVVAQDRPGLLSLISEAFVLCGIDVVDGNGFTRQVSSSAEALDIFWVRLPDDASFDERHELELKTTLAGLLEGVRPKTAPSIRPPAAPGSNSRVRFLEDESGALCTLEIETEDRTGLLLSLTRALHAQHVQIIRSEVKTREGRVFDRFVIAELDGSPVGPSRRLEIQVSVLSAAEPAKRLNSSPPSC